jgi:hypothetical protein
LQYREGSADGAFAVVVVGLRPAEISHHAVAKVFGNVSAESSDCVGRGTLVAGNHLPPLFGIELAGNLG